MATKHVWRLAIALHLAFLIPFMDYIKSKEIQEFADDIETGDCTDISSKSATKFQKYLVFGSSRNAAFALQMDMMRHCDDFLFLLLKVPSQQLWSLRDGQFT